MSSGRSHRHAHAVLVHLPVSNLENQNQQQMTHHRKHLLALERRRMPRSHSSIISTMWIHPTLTLPQARSRLPVILKPLTPKPKRRLAPANGGRKRQRPFIPHKPTNPLLHTLLLRRMQMPMERMKGGVRKCTVNSSPMTQMFLRRNLCSRISTGSLHPTLHLMPKMHLQWDQIRLELKATIRASRNSFQAIGIAIFRLAPAQRLPSVGT